MSSWKSQLKDAEQAYADLFPDMASTNENLNFRSPRTAPIFGDDESEVSSVSSTPHRDSNPISSSPVHFHSEDELMLRDEEMNASQPKKRGSSPNVEKITKKERRRSTLQLLRFIL